MSTTYEYAKGQYHIHVKLKGEESKIHIFHSIIEKCDGAWPWGATKYNGSVSVCRKCKGFVLSNPRIAPQDIKAAAEQAGVAVKIYVFSPQNHCFSIEEWKHIETIPRDSAKALYSHKPKRITVLGNKIYIGTEEVPRTGATNPKLIEPSRGKLVVLGDSKLIH